FGGRGEFLGGRGLGGGHGDGVGLGVDVVGVDSVGGVDAVQFGLDGSQFGEGGVDDLRGGAEGFDVVGQCRVGDGHDRLGAVGDPGAAVGVEEVDRGDRLDVGGHLGGGEPVVDGFGVDAEVA